MKKFIITGVIIAIIFLLIGLFIGWKTAEPVEKEVLIPIPNILEQSGEFDSRPWKIGKMLFYINRRTINQDEFGHTVINFNFVSLEKGRINDKYFYEARKD